MEISILVFIAVYVVLLISYMFTKTSGKMYLRGPNKMILATMYYAFAAYFFTTQYDMLSYHLLLMVALFLAWMGDLFLLFDLNRGGDFFLSGNIAFAVYYMAVLTENANGFASFWWVIPVEIAIVCLFIFLAKKYPKTLKLGKMKWPMTLYISSITLNGIMGLAMMIALPHTRFALMGLGSFLFMISDYILTLDKFVIQTKKWPTRCNSAFYFSGLLFIVLGMVQTTMAI